MVPVRSHRHPSCAAFVCAIIVASIGAARRVDAAENDRACSAAYSRAKDSERSAHLLEARELLQTCAKAYCGKVLYEACTAMYTQVEADIPSVVPVVIDGNGAPRTDVQVTMDGEPLAARIDGRAVPVDPGLHEFVFSTSDGVFATRKVLVVEGQHNRAISPEASNQPAPDRKLAAVGNTGSTGEPEKGASPEGPKLAADNGVAEPPAKRRSLMLPYTLASVGLVGLAGFGLMTEWGRKDNTELAQCSPACPPSSVNHVRRMYVAADVSLGVGIAALAGAYWAFVHSRSGNDEQSNEQALLFDVQPTRSGAVAGVSGSFR